MKHYHLIYPHQLFAEVDQIPKETQLVFIEDPLFFTQYRFHKHKLVLHRASMQIMAEKCTALGWKVRYVEFHELEHTSDIAKLLKIRDLDSVSMWDPVDTWVEQRICAVIPHIQILESPNFFLDCKNVQSYFSGYKKHSMAHFYQMMRKKTGYLMENGKPLGGRWSFDTENRKKLPPTITPASLPTFCHDKTPSAFTYVNTHFGDNPGSSETFFLPVTHRDAESWLDVFLKERLHNFGPYEDAISTTSPFVFHSLLSPLINCGLLSPIKVVEKALRYAEQNDIPLASVEGFLRQILGWREYMRGVYVTQGTFLRNQNHMSAGKKMPASFYLGTTSLVPFDHSVKNTLQHAYAHHIERLMIMGNLMALCEINPHEIYTWFMELFIDAYDWVMVPNVYGMSQFAAGTLMTTKPYVSGSAYILRMSNHKRGPWCDIWDGLYWQFVEKHREIFEVNPRVKVMTKYLDSMPSERKDHLWNVANAWQKEHLTLE